MDLSTFLHVWVKARMFSTKMDASVTEKDGSYRRSSRSFGEDVLIRLKSIKGCSLGARFYCGAGGVGRASVVETWLGFESDAEAILETADDEL